MSLSECKYCGTTHLDIREQIFKDGTKHLAIICSQCHRHNGFQAQGTEDERMEAFVIPFGKHRGKFLKDVIKEDFNYCKWMSEAHEKNRMRHIFSYFVKKETQ